MTTPKTKSVDTYGVDESNYAFMCIGLVSDKTVYKSLHREWTVTSGQSTTTRKLKIEPGVDTGVPTGFDIRLWWLYKKSLLITTASLVVNGFPSVCTKFVRLCV